MKNNEVHIKYHEHLDFPSHISPLEKEYSNHLAKVPFEGQCNEVAKIPKEQKSSSKHVILGCLCVLRCLLLSSVVYIFDFFQPCKGIYFVFFSGVFALAAPCS